VDYWALGILLYELLCCRTPFEHDNQAKIFEMIVNSTEYLRFPPFGGEAEQAQAEQQTKPPSFDVHAKSLIRKLLTRNYTMRLGNLRGGVRDIIGHRWFSEAHFDFEALYRKEVAPPFAPRIAGPLDTTYFGQHESNLSEVQRQSAVGVAGDDRVRKPNFAHF